MTGTLLLLTGAAFWPWPARMGRKVVDLHDPLFHAWGLAWASHALVEAPGHLFDANIFYPRSLALVRSESMLGLLPLAAPFRLLGAGPVAVLNALVLLSFPLTGLTMFWLVRHHVGQAGPAAVAAILYAFAGYRFSHLGHVPLLHHEALPLMLLGLHRAFAGEGRWRDVSLAAGSFLILALSSGYYAFFGSLAGLLLLAWAALPVTRPRLGRAVRRGAAAAGLVGVVMAPLGLAMAVVRHQDDLARERAEVQGYAARPSSYLAAPETHWLLGSLTAPLRRPESALFPGVVTVVLAAVGVAAAFRAGPPPPVPASPVRGASGPGPEPAASPGGGRPRWARLADGVLTAVLLVTAVNALVVGGIIVDLGPVRLQQRSVGPWIIGLGGALLARRLLHGRPVPLPGLGWVRRLGWPNAPAFYLLLAAVGALGSFGLRLELLGGRVVRPLYFQLWTLVPGFDALRVPARFAVLVTTALAVLAGYGVSRLAGSRPDRRRMVLLLVAGLAVAETWPGGLSRDTVPPHPVPADRWLASAPPGPVAVLPIYGKLNAHHEAARILGSTAHWLPLVNGYSSYYPRGYFETGSLLNTFPAPAAVAELRALGVRYVVVYPGLFDPAARQALLARLGALPPGLAPAATLEGAVIVTVGPPA